VSAVQLFRFIDAEQTSPPITFLCRRRTLARSQPNLHRPTTRGRQGGWPNGDGGGPRPSDDRMPDEDTRPAGPRPPVDLGRRAEALQAMLREARERGLTPEEEQALAELTAALRTLLGTPGDR
jgi:hypothetical protein